MVGGVLADKDGPLHSARVPGTAQHAGFDGVWITASVVEYASRWSVLNFGRARPVSDACLASDGQKQNDCRPMRDELHFKGRNGK